MSDELRSARTIHIEIPGDAPPAEVEAFEDALADFVFAPAPRMWDPFIYAHAEACEHSDHCYGPGSKAERAFVAQALRDAAAAYAIARTTRRRSVQHLEPEAFLSDRADRIERGSR